MNALLAAFIGLLGLSSTALAQPTGVPAPPNVKTERFRLSLGSGLSAVGGPDAQVDGDSVAEDGPTSLPMPSAVARVEIVLDDLFLAGLQSSLFMWEVYSDKFFGGGPHVTLDVSALFKLRFSVGSYRQHEIVASIPLGPSFELYQDVGPRAYGGEMNPGLGWHAGLLAGYTYSPVHNPLGFFADAGLIYHRMPISIEYETATEEITYQPIEAVIRFGMMIPLR